MSTNHRFRLAALLWGALVLVGDDPAHAGSEGPERAPAAAPVTSLPAEPDVDGWFRNHAQALTQARTSGRPVFLLFTNPTNCRPCIWLEKEVLCTTAFVRFAETNLVLLKADFSPSDERDGDRREHRRRQQASLRLRAAYPHPNWPHAFLLNSDGEILGEIDGRKDLPQYLAAVRQIMPQAR